MQKTLFDAWNALVRWPLEHGFGSPLTASAVTLAWWMFLGFGLAGLAGGLVQGELVAAGAAVAAWVALAGLTGSLLAWAGLPILSRHGQRLARERRAATRS